MGEKNLSTQKYLGDHDLVFAKGIYPYSYMTSPEKFKETKLPPIDAFYDSLNEQALDAKDWIQKTMNAPKRRGLILKYVF